MSYQDFTTAIKPTIERMLNLGAKFCFELAVKVGVFRGRIVVMRQFESQIEPQQLGGPDGYIRYGFGGSGGNQWQVTSDIVKGVQKGKDKYWFTTKFDAELNKIIPDNLKYLRKEALERACEIFETAIEQEKTKEEAMKEVKDSNILIDYSKKADEKIAENNLLDELFGPERKNELNNEGESEML